MEKAIFSVKFVGYKVTDEKVFYEVTAHCSKNGRTLQLQWRYSTLEGLHKRLALKFPRMPTFPAKKWFGNLDPAFIIKRKTELQNYVNNLLKLFKLQELDFLSELLQPLLKEEEKAKPQSQDKKDRSVSVSPEVTFRKKCQKVIQKCESRLICISNETTELEEDQRKRRKEQYEKIKLDCRSKIIEQLSLAYGDSPSLDKTEYLRLVALFPPLPEESRPKFKLVSELPACAS